MLSAQYMGQLLRQMTHN